MEGFLVPECGCIQFTHILPSTKIHARNDWKNISDHTQRSSVSLGIMGDQFKTPLKPLILYYSAIVLRCFKGTLNSSPIMPRDEVVVWTKLMNWFTFRSKTTLVCVELLLPTYLQNRILTRIAKQLSLVKYL